MSSSNDVTATATTDASSQKATSYSYRNRDDIKTPTAFPVAFSPLRVRSTKRINRGYKTTATVKMPTKVKRDNVSKTWSPSMGMTAEQKAAIRAARLEARRLAKGKQTAACEDVVDGDVDMDDSKIQG